MIAHRTPLSPGTRFPRLFTDTFEQVFFYILVFLYLCVLTDSTDSPDCLLLSTYVFFTFYFFYIPLFNLCGVDEADLCWLLRSR